MERMARLPDGLRLYVTGDIHGRVDLLEDVLATIDADKATRPCALAIELWLGDYIDRGPHSAQVIEQLWLRGQRQASIALCGNHELYMMLALDDPAYLERWRQVGAGATLSSYGLSTAQANATPERVMVELARRLPAHHRAFLNRLAPFHICGDYLFVHAGLRPGIALSRQNLDDFLSIRGAFLDYEGAHGYMIIHGHTPVAEPDIRHNRINIDTRAYASNRLTCLVLEGEEGFFLK
jgi:serine/threonine protein phosphatase 1